MEFAHRKSMEAKLSERGGKPVRSRTVKQKKRHKVCSWVRKRDDVIQHINYHIMVTRLCPKNNRETSEALNTIMVF